VITTYPLFSRKGEGVAWGGKDEDQNSVSTNAKGIGEFMPRTRIVRTRERRRR